MVHGCNITLPRDVSATLYPSEGCFSDLRGSLSTQKSQTSQKNSYGIIRTSGTGLGQSSNEEIFIMCSHIQKTTHSPNPIFKITIYCTKYTKNTKMYLKKE